MLYQSDALNVFSHPQGIAEIRFDSAGSVNKFDQSTLVAFGQALACLQQLDSLSGVLISHHKADFMVGADITEFLPKFALPDAELSAWLVKANQLFNQLEDLNVPTVTAMRGFALGGGCECALASDYRIADATLTIGLPEVKLGIMPGFGGSVRLPRLIGADNALLWISTGKQHSADAALAVGVIDAIIETDDLQQAGLDMLMTAAAGKLDWQARRQQKKSPLTLNAIEAGMCFATANAMVGATAGHHYPAPVTAVKAIEKAAGLGRDEALMIENKHFVKLAKTNVAKSLVGIFLHDQQLKQQAKKMAKQGKGIQNLAVLGAGIMGGGIAYQAASHQLTTVMKDINQGALKLGMHEANKLLNKQLERGKINGQILGETLANITPSLHYETLANADVVIEAVVENPKVKMQVLAETEQHVSQDCVLASNTSTIPISLLSRSLANPERFCGMHFFNPVHRMPLVEVIRGDQTAETTINTVVALASKMGKVAIVVNDCPGFFVNRVLFPYFFGFAHLIAKGVDFAQIDKVMEGQFGWPMGPAYLLDVVGIDTAHHAGEVMAQGYPTRMAKQQADCIDVFYQAQRFGQKNGEGFYHYARDKKGQFVKEIASSAYDLLAQHYPAAVAISDDEIIDYLMIPMVNEVLHCLDEEIVATPAQADIALVYGLGFPPFRGGAIAWLQHLGLTEFIAKADALVHLGSLYQVPESLRQKAAAGDIYY